MSVYPAWATGDVLSASYLRDSRPKIIQTTTIQTCDSLDLSGALDNELFFYAEANSSYLVTAHVLFNQITTAVPLSVGFDTPQNVTYFVQSYGATDTAADFTSRTDTNLNLSAGAVFADHMLAADGLDAAIWVNVAFVVANVPGSIHFKWKARNGVTGTITRDAGSMMRVIRFS